MEHFIAANKHLARQFYGQSFLLSRMNFIPRDFPTPPSKQRFAKERQIPLRQSFVWFWWVYGEGEGGAATQARVKGVFDILVTAAALPGTPWWVDAEMKRRIMKCQNKTKHFQTIKVILH